jgi:deazaflavin-dependent oxidoreductase (nitroreductase family)
VSVQEPIDNPTGWVNRHIRSYVESGGKRGHRWQGADTLLLITRGRRSGELRRTALIYGRDGDRFVVVGSNGGSSTHPAWYLNLVAHPDVTVQVGEEVLEARARDATPDERPRLWELMTGIWPDYDNYQRRTDRQIPVVVIERR